MHKSVKNNKGLTLVEIVISLAILAVIVVPLGALFINSVMVNKRAEVQLLANRTAQQYMENYKMKDFDVLSLGTTTYNEGDMVVDVVITSIDPIINEADVALNVILTGSNIEFYVAGVNEFTTHSLDMGRTRLGLNFEGTDYADSVKIMDGPNPIHTIHDLHGSTNDKTIVNIAVDISGASFNFDLSNVSNNSVGPLEVHKYVAEGDMDNTTIAIVNGHIVITNHEGRLTIGDRLQTAGLVITVRVSVDGEQIVEVVQAKKLEW
ncbi:MAG: type IV pilus modification PilV family protein [Alkaliphilus sp.]